MIEPASKHRDVLPVGYRKHRVIVYRQTPGAINVSSYWDGGSRYEYLLIRGRNRTDVTKRINPLNPPSRFSLELDLKAGDVLVKHGISCGKPAFAVITYVDSPVPQPAESPIAV